MAELSRIVMGRDSEAISPVGTTGNYLQTILSRFANQDQFSTQSLMPGPVSAIKSSSFGYLP